MDEELRYSVVIPTFRRAFDLARCLEAICALDYPRAAHEVVVVDDDNCTGTSELLAQFRHRLTVREVAQPERGGPAAARNAGVAAARGRYVVLMDDDCVPSLGWLRAFDAALAAEQDADVLLGGHVANALPSNPYAVASQYLLDFLYEWYNPDPRQARFFASSNIACRRSSFLALGGFDPLFPNAAAEDRDLCDRWQESGRRMVYVPNAVVLHAHRDSLSHYWKQHAGYGRGAVDLHAARDRRQVSRPRLEPMRFYLQLLLYPARRSRALTAPLYVLLASVSQLAYAWGYYSERWRRRRVTPAAAVSRSDAVATNSATAPEQADTSDASPLQIRAPMPALADVAVARPVLVETKAMEPRSPTSEPPSPTRQSRHFAG